MVVLHRLQPHNAYSRLQVGVTLLFLMLGSFFPHVVFAQAPQPASLSVDRNSLPQGACYILAAEDGANVILDVQYTFNNGPVQTVRGWPRLDDTGRARVCTDSATVLGSYAFVAMRNTLNAEWVPVQVPVAVTPPLQPTFLSVSPSTVTPGGCYVVFVENGADVTLDIQYAFNAGSAQTVRGWPKLDSSGRAYVCASPDTAIGDYFFLAIRNAVTADWVPVRATVSVKEPKPVSRIQLARDPLSEVIERALAVHGDGWITGRIVDSVSEGTLTWYTVDGPDPAFNMTLLAKGLRKVQRIVREPSADLRTGTDGTQTWHALSIGFWSIASGQALQFIESQTVRSIRGQGDRSGRSGRQKDRLFHRRHDFEDHQARVRRRPVHRSFQREVAPQCGHLHIIGLSSCARDADSLQDRAVHQQPKVRGDAVHLCSVQRVGSR